jgi:hypothetical protein
VYHYLSFTRPVERTQALIHGHPVLRQKFPLAPLAIRLRGVRRFAANLATFVYRTVRKGTIYENA